jgi:hypothetical protein
LACPLSEAAGSATPIRQHIVFHRPSRYPTGRPGLCHALEREGCKSSGFVSANLEGKPCLGTSISRLRRNASALKIEGKRGPAFSANFALRALRHTMLTRLGKSGVDVFTPMKIAGRGSIVGAQRSIHPAPEAVECVFERLQRSDDFAEDKPKRLSPTPLTGRASVSC